MDQQLFFLINRTLAHLGLDRVMAVASSWDFWWPFLALVGLMVLFLGGFRARAMVLAIGISVGITDGVVVSSLKDIVARPRPHEMLEGARTLDLARAKPRFLALNKPLRMEYATPGIQHAHGNSFPSGHASNTFAGATVITLFYRRWGWLAFLPAVLVSYSRIYVGSHWPFDVIVSCLMGVGIALFVVASMGALWRKFGEGWLPHVFMAHPELLPP